MNIELKPIAESKVRQLGGEIFGVVFRDRRGRFATITEMGFVTWLDGELSSDPEPLSSKQAARAQSGQGAEPVGYLHKRPERIPCFFETLDDARRSGCEVVPVYVHPQPAQQGSVPEGWSYVVEVFLENVEEVTELLLSGGDADNIVALCNDLIKAATVAEKVLATPQPEGDGWISMKDQFPNTFTPKLGWNKTANMRHQANTYRIFSPMAENVCDISHWMALPQPPKEDSGDE